MLTVTFPQGELTRESEACLLLLSSLPGGVAAHLSPFPPHLKLPAKSLRLVDTCAEAPYLSGFVTYRVLKTIQAYSPIHRGMALL